MRLLHKKVRTRERAATQVDVFPGNFAWSDHCCMTAREGFGALDPSGRKRGRSIGTIFQ